ncbi:hypothetical protein J2S49_001262 [Arcanobacterium wilhelmae]|uniref:FtsX-like permease family protein n=1 Tax=Arcanobacterium wilhelmae TaxID=1803177 RepID=A0ABT9NDB8_9ACTO|nr:hypothetical protein [Arcanobacterium wilhelmae]MDP9801186.1 hypothetical protein [Arcanobacterium wilhelmae]
MIVIVGVVALAAASPVFIRVAAWAFHWNVAAKMAGRDLVRNSFRSSAAVAAIMVGVIGATMAGAFSASTLSAQNRLQYPGLERGEVLYTLAYESVGGNDADVLKMAVDRANSVRPVASSQIVYSPFFDQKTIVEPVAGEEPQKRPASKWANSPGVGEGLGFGSRVMVVEPGDVGGMNFIPDQNKPAAKVALERGEVLTFDDVSKPLEFLPWGESVGSSEGTPLGVSQAPLMERNYGVNALMTPATVKKLGGTVRATAIRITFEQPITLWDNRGALRQALQGDGAEVQAAVIAAPEYEQFTSWLVICLIAGGAVVFVAMIVVAMSARAARQDMDTVEALGGAPGFRRAFSSWHGVITAVAAVVPGALVGEFGVWLARNRMEISEIGYEPLAVVLIGVVIVAVTALAGAIFPPGRGVLTRRAD